MLEIKYFINKEEVFLEREDERGYRILRNKDRTYWYITFLDEPLFVFESSSGIDFNYL